MKRMNNMMMMILVTIETTTHFFARRCAFSLNDCATKNVVVFLPVPHGPFCIMVLSTIFLEGRSFYTSHKDLHRPGPLVAPARPEIPATPILCGIVLDIDLSTLLFVSDVLSILCVMRSYSLLFSRLLKRRSAVSQ